MGTQGVGLECDLVASPEGTLPTEEGGEQRGTQAATYGVAAATGSGNTPWTC